MLLGCAVGGTVSGAHPIHETGEGRPMNQPHRPAASRRDVLKLGAAAVAAAAFAPSLVRAFDHEDAEYGGFSMGIQSYTLRNMSLENALKALRNDLKLHQV